ncbi:MAG: DUF418 domain-containing protein [Euzebya sp.]
MTALPQPAPAQEQTPRDTATTKVASNAPGAGRGRIQGIDMARALAILGMVTVHFGPFDPETSTLVGKVYRFSYGRASVLFVLLAGVGISLLFRARPATQARIRIAWRVLVFFPVGVMLQGLPTPVAVILQFYAIYYALGGVVATLRTRWLGLLTVTWLVLGPLIFLALQDPTLGGRGTATDLGDPVRLIGDLLLTGFYPLVTWAPPLLIGLLVGRTDLRDTTSNMVLTVAGLATAAVAYGGSEIGRASGGDLAGSSLLLAEGHTGAPLNVLGTSGVAVAVLGICLLVARGLPRISWHLVAIGQMALTVYVGHLLVLAVQPEWLEGRASVSDAVTKVGRFYLVVAVLCVAWRAFFQRGPLEALLALPFKITTPGRAGGHGTDAYVPIDQRNQEWDNRSPQPGSRASPATPWMPPPKPSPPWTTTSASSDGTGPPRS